MTAFTRLSVSCCVMSCSPQRPPRRLNRHRFDDNTCLSVPERKVKRIETGSLLHGMMCKILEVKPNIPELVRDVEERFNKKREPSRQHVHFYCRIMKIALLRVVARHSTKCCLLIKVWKLNQTRHSYLPMQQLFDSSVGEAARLLWRAAWLSLPKVAFRERDKLHLS